MSLLQFLDNVNPLICRLYASSGPEKRSVEDISNLSGLSQRTVIRMSKLTTWRGTSVAAVENFMIGCGVNISDLPNPSALINRMDIDSLPAKQQRYLLSVCNKSNSLASSHK